MQRTVLISEDSIGDTAVVKAAIERGAPEWRPVFCDNFHDTLRMLDVEKVDLALIDLNMAHNGRSLLRMMSMNPHWRYIPRVVLSGENPETDLLRTVLDYGADYIVKGAAMGDAVVDILRFFRHVERLDERTS